MKKIFTTLTCFSLIIAGSAQNVGIGTSSPNASAALHISAGNKGVLFPQVSLLNTIDNTTVPAPAQNLIVFNTNPLITGGKGLFYNSGTALSTNWAKVGDLKLPYSSGTSELGYAFNIQNYHASTSSIGIEGFCQNGYGIYGASAAGTGVFATSTSGNALEVSGKVKIAGTGQTPANGKVLTSDANGNASWQGAVAFLAAGVFSQTINDGTFTKVLFASEIYDLGGNYNTSTKTFIAPVNGIYHFDIQTNWQTLTDDMLSSLDLLIKRNGVLSTVTKQMLEISANGNYGNNISLDCQLAAGDELWPVIFQNSGYSQKLADLSPDQIGNRFGGRLVVKL